MRVAGFVVAAPTVDCVRLSAPLTGAASDLRSAATVAMGRYTHPMYPMRHI